MFTTCGLTLSAVNVTPVAGVEPTDTPTPALTVTNPLLSVATAVKVCAPKAAPDHTKLYGEDVSVFNSVAPSKNSTLVTDAPTPAEAVAVNVISAPEATTAPSAGAVSATVGAIAGAIVNVADLVLETPLKSVTLNVIGNGPPEPKTFQSAL